MTLRTASTHLYDSMAKKRYGPRRQLSVACVVKLLVNNIMQAFCLWRCAARAYALKSLDMGKSKRRRLRDKAIYRYDPRALTARGIRQYSIFNHY